jgi:hypothetical protein
MQVLFAAIVEDVRDSRAAPEDLPKPDLTLPTSMKAHVQRVLQSRRYNDTSLFQMYPSYQRPVLACLHASQLLHNLHHRPDGGPEFFHIITQATIMRLLHEDVMRVRTSARASACACWRCADQARPRHSQGWEALIRIVTSPTPFLYRHLLSVLVFLFVFTFPFAFVSVLGWITVPASMMICIALYGLLTLAQELENPLGFDANDIDLTGFRDQIAVELHALFKHRFGEDVARKPLLTAAANRMASGVLSLVGKVKAGK